MTQSSGTSQTPIAAVFQTKDDARNAAKALKDANFEHVWIGVTEIADEHDHDHHGHDHGHKAHTGSTWNPFSPNYGETPEEVQAESGTTTRGTVDQRSQTDVQSQHDVKGEGGVGRLFGKGGSGLVDQLVDRGFSQSVAQQIDREIPDGATILTAEGDASSASSILSQYNGRLLSNAISPNYRGWGSTTTGTTTRSTVTGSTATSGTSNLGYDEDVFTTRSRNVTTGTLDVGDQSARRI